MASNPMQKKVRNSFLLGMLVTLVFSILIGAIVYLLFFSKSAKIKTGRGDAVLAYTLNQNVASGQVITSDMLTEIELYENMIPANYVDNTQLENLKLQDENGNVIYTYDDGEQSVMYMKIDDGNKLYRTITGKADYVIVEVDDTGYFRTTKGGEKEYLTLKNVPVVAKVNLYKNTVLTKDIIAKSDQIVTNDVRVVEYNMLTLPIDLMAGDYVDIRITFPTGQDFVVVGKKQIKDIIGQTIIFEMSEEEILMMSSAIVESYIMTASNIYVVRYSEPGNQTKAINTYTPTTEVVSLIEADSNIVQTAKAKLEARFNADLRLGTMNSATENYSTENIQNIETKMQTQIESAKKARQEYLESLEGNM